MNNQILQETIRGWHSKTPDSVHGVGWGYKTTNGITTDELCLVFAVVSKKPLAELTQEEILPTTLIVDNETVKTDVVESELAQALSNCHAETDSSSSFHRVSHRPLMGGISISHKEAGATVGTLGGMFKDKDDGSVVGLTNLHVVCPNVGAYGVYSAERPSVFSVWDIESKKMRQQGFTDGGGGDIGDVKRYHPMTLDATPTPTRINYIDAAVIGLDSSSLIDANSGSQLGPLSPVNYPVATTAEIDGLLVNGNFLIKSGRTTGYVGSSSACRILVSNMHHSESVDYRPGIITLHDLIRFTYADFGTNVVVGGDSGSILLADFSGVLKIVGLVFAGNDGRVGFACRIDRVMDQLNLEVLGSTTMINASNNWEFIDRVPSAASPTLTDNGKKYWECGKLGSGNTKYVTYNLPAPPPPTDTICPAGCNSANYDVLGTPELRVLYNVGTTGGPSAYCTYDQSGNGAEWCSRDAVGGTTIVRRGGSYAVGYGGISQRHREDQAPHLVAQIVGFRLASSVAGPLSGGSVGEFVPVGTQGNANDTRVSQDGGYYGSVDHLYYIGQYEITTAQYCAFLTAVGNLPYGVGSCRDDVFSLYNAFDSGGTVANNGITRSGSSGAYIYAPKSNYSLRPVTFVSWLNCARYANWMHNGKGTGDTETGAYALNGIAVPTIVPNKASDAIFWIPTENEWYKAAYYKGGSIAAGYWRYATQSDKIPTEVVDILSNGDGVVPANCVGTDYPTAPGICNESPDRVIVIQICNNNGIQDDNFDLSLNGTNIGNVDLNSANRVGVILIGSPNTSLYLGENPFQCDITGMPVIYFDPTLLAYGGSPVPLQNNLTMTTTQDNAFCSHGIVQIRSFLAVGSELTDNCYIRRDDYRGCNNDPIEILWMFSSVGVGNAEKVICCPNTEGEADCCAGPEVPCNPRPSPSPCITVCPPGYVLDPASCLCVEIPMCAECELVPLPDLRPEVKGYIYYVNLATAVFVPEIGDVMTSCNGGHGCDRTEFNPILQFTSSKVDANKHVNVNNVGTGPTRVPPAGWPLTGPDGWPVSGPKYDVADTFQFAAVDWTDIANCEIQLECKAVAFGGCHNGIAFVVLVGYTLDAGTPIIIFKGCLKANESAQITHGVKIGTICSGNERPCIINLCSPECNYANADEGVGSETNVGTNGGPSSYCTFDQGGNVSEWTDGDGLVQRGTTRIFGGDWHQGTEVLKSDYSWPAVVPETHDEYTGFRLCSSIDLSKLTVSHFVFVGDKGNQPGGGLGAVLHNYYIQRNEVTNEQYCNFLNSVAKTDTYDLYISDMMITRTGESGNYRYSPNLTYRDRPVVHVTYWNAARMANWISNGQPVGVQDATTTEDGAYLILAGFDIQPVNAINPNTLAAPTCFIPTEDMWYKAAYYKGGGTNAGYWQYPTQYNVAPTPVTTYSASGDGIIPTSCVPSPSPSPSVSPSPSPSVSPSPSPSPSPSVSPSPSPSPSPSVSPSPSPSSSVCPGCRHTVTNLCLEGVLEGNCSASTGVWVDNCCPPPSPSVDMLMVTVNDPYNVADTGSDTPGYGAVSYSYKIGKYPVTVGQYAAFLNAIGSTDNESYPLLPLNDQTIDRSGSAGSYTYSVINSTENRPIVNITWMSSARFCNWMSNGQPSGAQNSTTTENGAYDMSSIIEGNAVSVEANSTNPNTNLTPTYRMPTENEWYKAAYYSPNYGGTGVGGYWIYATQINTHPNTAVGSSNGANCCNQNGLLDVGAYVLSPSYYGTFDQSGSVWQWNDLDGTAGSDRGLRGGDWQYDYISSSNRVQYQPGYAAADIGFRLAGPSSTVVGAALTPTFGITTATSDGFTVQISNYNAAYAWAGTATESGTVSIDNTGLVTVTGVDAGTSSTATITTTRAGHVIGSAPVWECLNRCRLQFAYSGPDGYGNDGTVSGGADACVDVSFEICGAVTGEWLADYCCPSPSPIASSPPSCESLVPSCISPAPSSVETDWIFTTSGGEITITGTHTGWSGSSGYTGPGGDITIPSTIGGLPVVAIGNTTGGFGAFETLTNLTSVTIPCSVTSIGWLAFCRCPGLTCVSIPNSVISIGDEAFRACIDLTSVSIPASVASIGYSAFHYCPSLTSVTIPNTVTSLGRNAFQYSTGLTNVTISSSISTIESQTFRGCTGLTSVSIPSSVTSIGVSAFSGCTGLTSVTFLGTPPAVGGRAFEDVTATVYYTAANAASWSSFSTFGGLTTQVLP